MKGYYHVRGKAYDRNGEAWHGTSCNFDMRLNDAISMYEFFVRKNVYKEGFRAEVKLEWWGNNEVKTIIQDSKTFEEINTPEKLDAWYNEIIYRVRESLGKERN